MLEGTGPGSRRTSRSARAGSGGGPRVRAAGRTRAAAAALFCAAGAFAAAACGDPAGGEVSGSGRGVGDDGPAAGASGGRRVINVEVRVLGAEPFTEVVRLTGTAAPYREVRVAAEEAGVIRELPVEKGTPVEAGQVIARIDDALLRTQVDEARAQANVARETWERRRRLYERDGAISELDYLSAKYGAEEAEARLAHLEERLRRTRVRAPVEGVLDERHVEVGTMVSPGTAVARIVDLDPVRISAGVPERYASDVTPGTEVRAAFDVLPDTTYTGRLSYVGASVDRESRTFPVELVLDNPGGRVKPRMVADVEVVRRRWSDAVVVPQAALVRTEEGFTAFVVEEGGEGPVARERRVEPGPGRENRVVVTEGLSPGDRLVVVGQNQVAEGDRVKIVGSDGR